MICFKLTVTRYAIDFYAGYLMIILKVKRARIGKLQ